MGALRAPPTIVRYWELTAGVASAAIDLRYTDVSAPQVKASKSILIINGDAANNAIVNLVAATAGAIGAGLLNIGIRSGDRISIDGEFQSLAYIRDGAADATPIRVIVSY